jgi:hypothetical protein
MKVYFQLSQPESEVWPATYFAENVLDLSHAKIKDEF